MLKGIILTFATVFTMPLWSQSGDYSRFAEKAIEIEEKSKEDLSKIAEDIQQRIKDRLEHKNVVYDSSKEAKKQYSDYEQEDIEDTAKLVNDVFNMLRETHGLNPSDCVTLGRGKTGGEGHSIELGDKSKYDDFQGEDSGFTSNSDVPTYSRQDWSEHLRKEIAGTNLAQLTPPDTKEWCPAYSGFSPEDRVNFWFHLMMGMSYYESNWRAKHTFKEKFSKSKTDKTRVLSSGLFQISVDSSRAYGGENCSKITQEELFDPTKNVSCSVHILQRLVNGTGNRPNSDNYISQKKGDKWIGGAAYWSVLRNPEKKGGIRQYIQKNIPACR